MKVEIKIPAMGESVVEATVSNILKPTGSSVNVDEEIVELETDKVNQVLYAPATGTLTLNVTVGQKVKIGEVIGSIEEGQKKEVPAPAPAAKPEPAPKAPAPTAPAARKMVSDFTKEFKAAPPAPPSIEKASRKKMSNLRKVIAQRLVEVKNTTAMLTTFNEANMSNIMKIRAKEKDNFVERYGVRLGFMSFFVKAVVSALKAVPEVNSYIEGDEIVTFKSYDIGVAVSTEKGLMVPVIRNCDTLSFGAIESAIESFAKKAREGKISVDDLRGGSFTITNGGKFGSLLSTPILNPPQSAILGMHTILKRPIVVGDDQIIAAPMMYLALSYDHRVIDGKEAVLFLVHIKENLEDPTRLLLDL